jgi:hypothetical protein
MKPVNPHPHNYRNGFGWLNNQLDLIINNSLRDVYFQISVNLRNLVEDAQPAGKEEQDG